MSVRSRTVLADSPSLGSWCKLAMIALIINRVISELTVLPVPELRSRSAVKTGVLSLVWLDVAPSRRSRVRGPALAVRRACGSRPSGSANGSTQRKNG